MLSSFQRVDKFVDDQRRRAKAAEDLRTIARDFPDLLEEFIRWLEPEAGNKLEDAQISPPSDVRPESTNRKDLKYDSSPTFAVKQWLRRHPDGGTSREIATAILPYISTESTNAKGLIYATLASLERRKKIHSIITADGLKRFVLAEYAEQERSNGPGGAARPQG